MIKFLASDNGQRVFLSALRPLIFPAGESHVTREHRRHVEKTEIAVLYGSTDLNSDLFTLKMWSNYLDDYPKTAKILIIPYFPGARMDRGRPFGLQVYVDAIHALHLDMVAVFDPHSQTTPELLNAQKGLNARYLYPEDLLSSHTAHLNLMRYTGVIAPDEGARLRAEGVGRALGVPVFQATKKRDFGSGQLFDFDCEPLPQGGKFLLADDICDRGGTFLGLAKHLGLPKEQLDLYVSHGVFSSDATETLPEAFGSILTTNSYAPERKLPESFARINVIDLLIGKAMTK